MCVHCRKEWCGSKRGKNTLPVLIGLTMGTDPINLKCHFVIWSRTNNRQTICCVEVSFMCLKLNNYRFSV